MPDFNFTDYLKFYPSVDKFRVAKIPVGERVFISSGPGGKGSAYIELSAEQALEFARYLTVEAQRALEFGESNSKKKG